MRRAVAWARVAHLALPPSLAVHVASGEAAAGRRRARLAERRQHLPPRLLHSTRLLPREASRLVALDLATRDLGGVRAAERRPQGVPSLRERHHDGAPGQSDRAVAVLAIVSPTTERRASEPPPRGPLAPRLARLSGGRLERRLLRSRRVGWQAHEVRQERGPSGRRRLSRRGDARCRPFPPSTRPCHAVLREQHTARVDSNQQAACAVTTVGGRRARELPEPDGRRASPHEIGSLSRRPLRARLSRVRRVLVRCDRLRLAPVLLARRAPFRRQLPPAASPGPVRGRATLRRAGSLTVTPP